MPSLLRLACCILLVSSLCSCVTRDNQAISRNLRVYPQHPISVRIHGKVIDEDSPMEYTVRFRNVGRQVASFDYTVADQRGVPHVDRDGPDSGFVANLYPGAEVEVVNPKKVKRVWVTLGTITYGRKTNPELDAVYRSTAALTAQQTAEPSLIPQ
jgi:hypothetical protein